MKKKAAKKTKAKANLNIASGKRKKATARAIVTPGKGRVRINKIDLERFQPEMSKYRIMEPLLLAGNLAHEIDVEVNVSGGGITGQTDAARTAISNAILSYAKDSDKLKEKFVEYDRTLVVSDVRQKETRKPNTGGKARAKVQKSYR